MHALLHSVPPTLQQAAADPCLLWRLLDTHGQVWVRLLWGHCSFLLGPGAHTVLFVPAKSLLPQVLCKFWRHYGGVNGDLLQEGLYHTQVCCTQSPWPCTVHCWSASPQETLKHSSVPVSVWFLGPGVHRYIWALWASLASMVFSQVSWIGSWRRQ